MLFIYSSCTQKAMSDLKMNSTLNGEAITSELEEATEGLSLGESLTNVMHLYYILHH